MTEGGARHDGMTCYTDKNQDKSCDLSCLVEQVLEISNEFIHGFKAVIDFAINPSIRIR